MSNADDGQLRRIRRNLVSHYEGLIIHLQSDVCEVGHDLTTY